MKKYLFIAALAMGAMNISAQAQTFKHQSGSDTARGVVAAGQNSIEIHNKIENTTNSPIEISWQITDTNLPTGWSIDNICDNLNCFFGMDLSRHLSDTIARNGGVGDMKVTFDASGAANNSTAHIVITEAETNSGYTLTNTFIATKSSTGISVTKVSNEDVTLYPNPIKGNQPLKLVFNPNLGVKNISVYNVIGKLAAVYKVTDSRSAQLNDIDKLPSGVYLIRLTNSRGEVVATKRFTNQQ